MTISGMTSMCWLVPTTGRVYGTAAPARQLASIRLRGDAAGAGMAFAIAAKPNTVQRPLGLAGGTTG